MEQDRKLQKFIDLQTVEAKDAGEMLDGVNPDDWELLVKAHWSTPDVDRMNDIVLPTAFQKNIGEFLDNPVMMFNHDPAWTIGRWFNVELTDSGPVSYGGIAKTNQGRAVAELIRQNVVSKTSFMFIVKDEEQGQDGAPNIIKEVVVFEAGPVSVPANINAVIEQAKAKGINTESLVALEVGAKQRKGPSIMDATKLKEEVTKDLDRTVDERVDAKAGQITDDLKKQFHDFVEEAKKSHSDSASEYKTKLEQMTGDFTQAMADLEKQVDDVKRRAKIANAVTRPGMKAADIIQTREPDLAAFYNPSSNEYVRALSLQEKNDQVLMMDHLMSTASQHSGVKGFPDYHLRPRDERIRELKLFGKVSELAKALDTETTGEGEEFIPTIMSSRLFEQVLEASPVAQQFMQVQMPSPTWEIPVDGSEIEATLHGQKTTYISAFDSTEQTPGSDDATMTAKKFRTRIQVAKEMTEDAVFSIMEWLWQKHVRGHQYAIATAVINGQNTATIDTGDAPASTDARYAWDGLRYMCQSDNKIDLGTLSYENMLKLLRKHGKYAQNASDNFFFTSIEGFFQIMISLKDYVATIDKFGSSAVIKSGSIASILGRPILVDGKVRADLNSSGVYDGAGNSRTIIGSVYAPAFWHGIRREEETWSEYDGINDVYQTVTWQRRAFKCLYDHTSENVITLGINVDAGS